MGLLSFEWIDEDKRETDTAPLLKVEHITVRQGTRLVLDNVSFDIYEGEQVRVTGPNGAGKSTLLNAITGVLPLETGRILFNGEDISGLPVYECASRGIRYMRQRENVFPSLTVRENLQLALGSNGYEKFSGRFPEWVTVFSDDIAAGMLSGGEKQKLAWGMTVLSDYKLILLDEPAAGVSDIMSLELNNEQCAIWVTHD